ncbi:crossover junction endodeoxyribonuclease RuvC [Thiolapillus brandeum]|uniref:Crossover junction endodeoxyribonuclease RuvC n=1 Tax=Thiolapillus brandeum TaxID=1076588 RepID=A0A7U6JIS0_9GAMM|nr:crossover junction endodeoxyribonuclease RuvC [Thiolapillus brandeum]BAO45157.1 crossover junction endodeoxyribonuclease RuvC [Thiolapillus brandeum]
MRILGIDPGSRVTGFGVIDSDGRQSRHVFSGCIRTSSKDFCARLGEIFNGIQQVLEEHAPQQVAVEQVFMAANASSALKLGHARGAAITAAVVAQLPVYEYTPRAVKLALVGTGAAQKEQVQHMIRLLLGQLQPMGLDESDALAVALCHAHTHLNSQKLRGLS